MPCLKKVKLVDHEVLGAKNERVLKVISNQSLKKQVALKGYQALKRDAGLEFNDEDSDI